MAGEFDGVESPFVDGDSQKITELILKWQERGDQDCFAILAKSVVELTYHAATGLLARFHLRGSELADEVVSLVLDHLRRLHPMIAGEESVALFQVSATGGEKDGVRYLHWLAVRRTRDVLRSERRRSRRWPTFTEVLGHHEEDSSGIPKTVTAFHTCQQEEGSSVEKIETLRQAVAALDAGSRTVMEMMLEGKSQKEIADSLGVNEETISRRKTKAFYAIRKIVTEHEAPSARSANGDLGRCPRKPR